MSHGADAPDGGGTATAPAPVRVFLLDDHEVVRARARASCWSATATSRWSASPGRRARPPGASPRCARTWRCSTPGCPTATASTSAATSARSTPTIQGLILTSYDDDEALFAAIMAGAAGYVLKQIRGTDLVDAIRRVAAGQSLLDPAVTARVLERLRDGDPRTRGSRPDRPGAADPRPDRRGADQPADRRADVPGREDGEELRLQPAGQARHGAAHAGRGLRHPAGAAPREPGEHRRTSCTERRAGPACAVSPGRGPGDRRALSADSTSSPPPRSSARSSM